MFYSSAKLLSHIPQSAKEFEFDIACMHCMTGMSSTKTRCPWGVSYANWAFEKDKDFLNDTENFRGMFKLII